MQKKILERSTHTQIYIYMFYNAKNNGQHVFGDKGAKLYALRVMHPGDPKYALAWRHVHTAVS